MLREEDEEAVNEPEQEETQQEGGDAESGHAEHLAREHVHGVADNHGWRGAEVAQVPAHLHARVSAADDEHSRAPVRLAGLVLRHMGHLALERAGAGELRQTRFSSMCLIVRGLFVSDVSKPLSYVAKTTSTVY